MTVVHRCQWCDGDYPCDTFVEGEDEHGHPVSRCDCQSKDECIACSPDLYRPLCVQCDEMGEYALGVAEVEGPFGRQWACARHVAQAEEAGAALWDVSDGGSAPSGLRELQAAADRLNREGRY